MTELQDQDANWVKGVVYVEVDVLQIRRVVWPFLGTISEERLCQRYPSN